MPTDLLHLPGALRADVLTLWDYHKMHHALRPCDVGIGLGSHDPSVATFSATLYLQGLIPLIVFTGANAPTTADRFPYGEAVHYREAALVAGVPPQAILVEPRAANTGENIRFARDLLQDHGITPNTALLVSRPYQQRRAYATCKKVWPEIAVICASVPLDLDAYIAVIGDAAQVVNMLVGDTQRIVEYARRGFAVPQPMPREVSAACNRLANAGYTERALGLWLHPDD